MLQLAEKVGHPRIGLLGNPNTGKSTVFNRLTGMRQRVANYPGITVSETTGSFRLGEREVDLVDLPGTYGLGATSADERVVFDALVGRDGRPPFDLLVCVLDAANLERNLYLPLQLAEFDVPIVLVLNQWDVVKKRGVVIDLSILSERMGVPVVPLDASKGIGLADLLSVLSQSLEIRPRMKHPGWPESVNEGIARLLSEVPDLKRVEALRLIFDGGGQVLLHWEEQKERIVAIVGSIRDRLRGEGINPGPGEAVLQYRHISRLIEGVVTRVDQAREGSSDTIDRILLHRFWGMAVFLGVMWVVFQSVYSWAGPVMDGIDALTGALQGWVSVPLEGYPVVQSLLVDGVIAGVGGVLIFLPQILVLFLFIGLLEDSGYMARAAFLMDRVLGWCGLNGKSFVPLLSSYACAVPGILAARTLENRWARGATILMAPFMSCSARLPVYVLLIGAFVEPRFGAFVAGFTLFCMHFVGLAVAAPLAWVAFRISGARGRSPFILEMPDYKVPNLRNLWMRMWLSGREFLVRAGTVIFAFAVIIWALLYFPRSEEVAETARAEVVMKVREENGLSVPETEALLADSSSGLAKHIDNVIDAAYLEDSYLGRFGHFVQPAFAPAGYDWKITVGILSSFPARELLVATMGIIYHMGPEVDEDSVGLREQMAAERWTEGPLKGQPVFTLPVVFSILVFFALCMQCGATVAVIGKEMSWSAAAFSFFGMTVIAWLAAVIVYQVGTALS